MPNIEQQLQSVREDVAALVRERDAAWVDSTALKAEVDQLKAQREAARVERKDLHAKLVDSRDEVDRLKAEVKVWKTIIERGAYKENSTAIEIERLNGLLPPERAIVIDPGENPQADEIVRVAEFLSTSPNHHNSSPAAALRDLACRSQLFADTVFEMGAAEPPKPKTVTMWRVTSRGGQLQFLLRKDAMKAMAFGADPFRLEKVKVPADE